MEIIENKNADGEDTKTLMVNQRGSDVESQDISLLQTNFYNNIPQVMNEDEFDKS